MIKARVYIIQMRLLMLSYKEQIEFDWWKRNFDTFSNPCQRVYLRYCSYFNLSKDTFKDKSIVDIGCGPQGSLHFFNAKLKIGIDPLAWSYKEFNIKQHDIQYISSRSENIPLKSSSIDGVISVNSLDHVDNLENTLNEIIRILKSNGEIYLQLNLAETPTIYEPIIIKEKEIEEFLKRYFIIKEKKRIEKGSSISLNEEIVVYTYNRLILYGIKR